MVNRRRIIGILLILIGLGTPLVLYFFQEDGVVYTIKSHKIIERKLSKDEINALNKVSKIKKELETLMPDYMKSITTNFSKETWWFDQLPNEKTGKPSVPEISFEEFYQKALTYESKLVGSVKASYAVNNFEKEAWAIDSTKHIEVPYRQIVGVGVLFTFLGLSFLIFSFFHKKKNA